MRAIILAGGRGTRLRPYTVTFPKPLVPLGGEMPVLEIIIRQLSRQGVSHVTLAVNHLANLIQAFFQDGSKWGLLRQITLPGDKVVSACPQNC